MSACRVQTQLGMPSWTLERAARGFSSPTGEDKEALWQRLGLKPFLTQQQALLSPARTRLVAGGVRSGKSLTTAMECLAWLPHSDLIWLVGPSYELARGEMIYLADFVVRLGWAAPQAISIPQDVYHPCSIKTRWGTEVTAKTSGELTRLAGRAPDALFFVEAGQQVASIYDIANERLSEKRGMLWFSGTLEEAFPWYGEMAQEGRAWPNPKDLASFCLPTWENTAVYPGGLDNPELARIRNITLPARFAMRYGGQAVAPENLVFAEFSPSIHVSSEAQYDPQMAVDLAIDPGWGRGEPGKETSLYVVLAIQWPGGMCHVIDEISAARTHTERIIAECRSRPWWGNVRSGVVDKAARQHHMGMRAPWEEWNAFTGLRLVWHHVPILDGIWRLRTFLCDPYLEGPRIRIHPACRRLIYELLHYQYAKDKEGRPVKDQPIDRYCDAVKALWYALWAMSGFVDHRVEAVPSHHGHRPVKFVLPTGRMGFA